MGIFGNKQQNHSGFTIVEIIIVVTVIAVLAGIVLVAYPGYQARTRDNERKSDVGQLATALGTYAFQKGNFVGVGSGCGRNGNGSGWVVTGAADTGAGTYPRSIIECLQDIKAVNTGSIFVDPSNCRYSSGSSCGSYGTATTTAYMKATCTKASKPITYVLARLEQQPLQNSVIDALCDAGSVSGFDAFNQQWGTNYGMNYYVVVK